MAVVDVIIPTRNRYEMTVAAVGSVIGQTFADFRVYVVDDASDDGSYGRLAERFAADSRVILIRREAPGRAALARQTGFDAGTSPWVATLDSDDLWHPQKLEEQLAVADGFDVVLSWHTWLHSDGTPRVTRRPTGSGSVSPLLTANVDVALMRRDVVDRVGAFAGDESTPHLADENVDFFIRLLAESRVIVVEKVLAWCRDHSTSRTSDAMTPETLRAIVESRRSILERHPADFGPFLCRLAARYAEARQWRQWRRYIAEGMSIVSWQKRLSMLREFGPHACRCALTRRSSEPR